MHTATLEDGTKVVCAGNITYLPDNEEPERFPGYYRDRQGGVAWRIVGAEIEGCEEWNEEFEEYSQDWRETGQVVAVMVGDDARHLFDPEDLTPIKDEDFCAVCGQIGCCHDGRERD